VANTGQIVANSGQTLARSGQSMANTGQALPKLANQTVNKGCFRTVGDCRIRRFGCVRSRRERIVESSQTQQSSQPPPTYGD